LASGSPAQARAMAWLMRSALKGSLVPSILVTVRLIKLLIINKKSNWLILHIVC
jgi:hypothetical protein